MTHWVDTSRQDSPSFVVTEHSTREVLHTRELEGKDVWLASQPLESSSTLMAIAMDPALSYHVVVEKRTEGVPSTYEPGTAARKSVADSGAFIARSGMEGKSSKTIWQDCKRHLEDMATIWDAFVAARPEGALLSDPYLRVPGSTIFVDQGDSEEQFNGKIGESYMRLVNVILSKLQEACAWWAEQASTSASAKGKAKARSDVVLPLPADLSVRVQATSYRKALNAEDVSLPALSALQGKAEPDFMVVCHKDIIATIESKPELKAKDTGVLVQDRASPCGTERGTTQKVPNDRWAKLLFQITSQSLAAKVSTGLLVTDWARILLPYDVHSTPVEDAKEEGPPAVSTRKRKREQLTAKQGAEGQGTGPSKSDLSIVFSSTISHCDAQRKDSLAAAQREGQEGLDGKCSGELEFTSDPNTAMFMVAWILRAYSLHVKRRALSDLEDVQEGQPGGFDRRDDEEAPGPSSQRGRDTKAGPGERSSAQAAQSRQGSSTTSHAPATGQRSHRRHSAPLSALVDALPCINTYLACNGPLRGGTFATLHWCFVDSEYLKTGSPSFREGGKEVLGGRIGFPSSSNPPGQTAAILKIQRIPFTDQERGAPPEPRFERGPGAQRPDKEEKKDIRERAEREVSAFQHCRDLQGVYIPKLYGLVSPRNEPVSSANKLMMQYIDGQALGTTPEGLIYLWRMEIMAGVHDAFRALHSRGLVHGDVSNNNVMLEWKVWQDAHVQSSSSKTVSSQEVRMHLQKALEHMGTHDDSLTTYTSKSAGIMALGCRKAVDPSDVPANVGTSPSPLERIKTTYTPRVWVVDFADSKIFKARQGKKAIALEDKEVQRGLIDYIQKIVQEMAQQETNPYSFAEENWKRAVVETQDRAAAGEGRDGGEEV
ncbi:hypothetical protein BCV69DRAFT_285667 [Microstroma glucosiphilum]|uniref:Uncharacterized protein n=1 Tax=Pseudomicrostroma glucosiphilum TaxID=1684307 RepID=A0A316TZN0_9BASI|nr:hypothetical protein BCV69DRAFT_285667 [Pseudomicrostroma glucosiphilum]PWN17781.1 hypothetical protein BCV69DRAFT_285667 [Pseudomicrostroma glucosiphilum]